MFCKHVEAGKREMGVPMGIDTTAWTAGEWAAILSLAAGLVGVIVGIIWWASALYFQVASIGKTVKEHIPENRKDHDALMATTLKHSETLHEQALSLNNHNQRLEFHEKRIEKLEAKK